MHVIGKENSGSIIGNLIISEAPSAASKRNALVKSFHFVVHAWLMDHP